MIKPTEGLAQKPDHKGAWDQLILVLRNRFFGDFTVQEKIANYMEQDMEPRFSIKPAEKRGVNK